MKEGKRVKKAQALAKLNYLKNQAGKRARAAYEELDKGNCKVPPEQMKAYVVFYNDISHEMNSLLSIVSDMDVEEVKWGHSREEIPQTVREFFGTGKRMKFTKMYLEKKVLYICFSIRSMPA